MAGLPGQVSARQLLFARARAQCRQSTTGSSLTGGRWVDITAHSKSGWKCGSAPKVPSSSKLSPYLIVCRSAGAEERPALGCNLTIDMADGETEKRVVVDRSGDKWNRRDQGTRLHSNHTP